MVLRIHVAPNGIIDNHLPRLPTPLLVKVSGNPEARKSAYTVCQHCSCAHVSVVKITITDNNFSGDVWPRVARGLCHWCCHEYTWVPALAPTWSGTHYHLRGGFCSWNCAKSDAISRTRAGRFPASLTALTILAFKTSFCAHERACLCHSRFTGIVPAPEKETLTTFGGSSTILQFRRGFLVITDYSRVERMWRPRVLCSGHKLDPRYLYTLEPLRRTKLIETEEEDPVVLIKRRVW